MRPYTFKSGGALVQTKTPFPLIPSYSTDWFPSMPPMSGGWPAAYSGIYERQLWVYVVVNKLAKATARLPMHVYQRTADGSRDRVADHPMAELLARPNPTMSGFDLWLWTSSMVDIHGKAFWLKRRKAGQVVALFPLHPAAMNFRDGVWDFDNGANAIEGISPKDLVHFRSFHPSSMTDGLSPLEPLRATLENEWNARTATSSFWARGARPGTALTHPGNLSAAAQERLRVTMDSLHAGANKTGGTVILEEGMDVKPLTLTSVEAQYIETRKLNREEVCAAYDVPPPVVQILDHATFSNITEQFKAMYRDTMAPKLNGYEATVEVDLRLAEFGSDDVYAEFLMDEVLRGDFEARQTALKMADHMTIAEKRKVENLPFIKGTDRIFLNTATMPLDAIDAQADALAERTRNPPPVPIPIAGPPVPAAPLTPPAATVAARTVAGRLSYQKTLDDVSGPALIEDLDDDHAGLVLLALHAERKADGSVADLRARITKELDHAP